MDHSCYILGRCRDLKALAAFVDGPALSKTFGLDFDHDFIDYLWGDFTLSPERRKLWDAPRLKKALARAEGKLPDANALIHLSDPIGPEVEIYKVRKNFMFIGPYADGGFEARAVDVPQLEPFDRYRALAKTHLGKDDDAHMLKVAAVHLAARVKDVGSMTAALIQNDPAKWRTSLTVNDVLIYMLKHDAEAWAIREAPGPTWTPILKALQG